MQTVYIIGNGFDLYHGLPTSYADFNQYVNETDPELAATMESYFDLKCNDQYLWQDFENDLGRYDHHGFFNNHNEIDVMSESFRPSDCFGLEDEITEDSENLVASVKEAFTGWIEAIKYPETKDLKSILLRLDNSAAFINFNYTDTVELLYGIPKDQVLYIHNNANDYNGELIFGHAQTTDGVDDSTFDENGEPTRTMFTDAQNAARSPFYAFQKDTAAILTEHQTFFENLREVEDVVVLGHSLGIVDHPYFQFIAKYAPNARWFVSCHGDSNSKKKLAVEMLKGHAGIRMLQFKDLV